MSDQDRQKYGIQCTRPPVLYSLMASSDPIPSTDLRSSRLHMASLLDLSSRVTEADPMDILNVAVLSLMGRLRVQRACVLLPQAGRLVAEARLCKGVAPMAIPLIDVATTEPLDAERAEHRDLIAAGLERIVPLTASRGLIGILCLGPTLVPDPDPDATLAYLDLARTIIGTAVHNAEMVRSLVETTKELEARSLMVSSLFETARDFTGAKTRDELLRIMSYRLMGQLMVSTFGLFLTEELDGGSVIVNRREAEHLAEAFEDVMSIEQPMRTADLDDGDPRKERLQALDLAMAAPMTVHGVRKGVLATCGKLNGQPFSSEELSFLQAIGTTAMTAIENERLIQEELVKQRLENELQIAAEIQRKLLPETLPQLDGLQIAASAETSRVIGGDYYDVIPLDEYRTLFAIADVAGKGIPAALLMANVQAALNVLAWSELSLTSLAEKINVLVCQNTEPEVFITMFLAVIDTRTRGIEYVNAGHNPPILIHGSDVTLLSTGGVLTGVIPDPPPYRLGVGSLADGDLLVLYTDGVTETRNGRQEYGVGALVETLHANVGKGADEVLQAVQRSLRAFAGQQALDDDTSMVVIKVVQR